MKYLATLFCFSFILSSQGSAQKATPPVTNYSTKDYGRDFHPTNMAIAQDQHGIIYVANGFKLLEYDSRRWNSYPLNKEAWILSLAIDKSGIIYAGSQNEFGYFSPDPHSGLKYKSLSDSLNEADNDFTNIWKVYAFSGGVVFQSEEKLFLFRNGKIEIIRPATSFHTSFIVNDKLFVRERQKGLMELKDNDLVKVDGSEIFDTTGIFLMLPFGKNSRKILIGTRENGFWIYEPENLSSKFHRLPGRDLKKIEKAKITGGVLLADGTFAISTMLNGLMITDTTGSIRTIINRDSGLSDNDIKEVIPDQSRNLWLATNNGISTVEISSPLSVFSEKSGITGDIGTIVRYNNLLYAGTTNGLFVQSQEKESENQFIPAFNLTFPVRSIIAADGKLIAGTDAGLFQISGQSIKNLNDKASFTLCYSRETKLLLSGGPKGLDVFINEGPLRRIDILSDVEADIIGIEEINRGGTEQAGYWIGTRYKGVIRIKLLKDLSYTSEYYDSFDGLPGGPVKPYRFNSKITFATGEGLYGFTDENAVRETLPDSLKNNKDFLKGYFSPVPFTNGFNGKAVTAVVENRNKAWLCADNKTGYFDKENNLSYVTQPFNGIDVGKINVIYPEQNGICWFGTTDGLFRYDENLGKDYHSPFFSLIRKVSLTDNDSVLFNGSISGTDYNTSGISKPVLAYRNNSLRIEFASPFYEYPDKVFYSCKLGGDNSKWSQWKQANYQEYTNLREGSYTFRVKSRNVYGTESIETSYSFDIIPPWYRTSVAFIIYAILSIFLVWIIAIIYSSRLKRENIRLEGIVVERTSEIVRQKDEIENKNIVLEYQKKEIEDSIRYALRIQSAVIPSEKDCLDILEECFVFFRPLNIVSGDFYWISRVENKVIFTAADCTGHGVPGAIMSMLGVAFLNETVNKDHFTEPDKILNLLRSKIIQALQQQGQSGETRDGMDIAIVSIDEKEKKLQFAGAYNPLIMIRNGEIFETPGDKMPVGIYEKMNPFRCHEIMLEKGDVFYMASDGYEDQFGGPEGKKFKAKKFKQLLLDIHKYPMQSQKEIIEREFEEWKGDLKQIDDIVVIGIAIK